MKCIICKSRDIKLIQKDYPGYVEGTKFGIFKCKKCESHFISSKNASKGIYEIIYSHKNLPSYRRYYKYAKQIKKYKNPLKFLADSEPIYFLVYESLKKKSNLDILDVGCGYGYLTYSLNQSGHKAVGIDISKKAINFAKNNFGNYFIEADINSFAKKSRRKFDAIIATELIEHLESPNEFIKICLKLLKEGGKIIITSPNKDYIKKSVWQTDLPPVHTVWFGKKGLENIARNNKAKIEFVNFNNYYPEDWNNLINFFIVRKGNTTKPVLTKEGKINAVFNNHNSENFKKILRFILIDFFPIRYLSNNIHNLLTKEYPTLGAVISRK